MKRLNKKGFTLTEMIVVIAIIGILAAVLIPSVVIYVQRAQKSNDEQLAASMTDEIERYCIINDIDQSKLLGTDVRSILLFKDYDLTPSRNNWTYVYNAEERLVSVVDISTVVVDETNEFTDPTNYKDGYYLLGNGDSEIEKVVSYLCNVSSESVYNYADDLAESAGPQTLVDYFSFNETLFISNTMLVAKQGVTAFSKIVFAEKTVHIPSLLGSNLSVAPTITFSHASAILKTIDKDSELNDVDYIKQLNLNKVDESNLIDLSQYYKDDAEDLFLSGKNYDPAYYQLGEHYEEATSVVIETIVLPPSNSSIITHLFRVSYFNENGLFARFETPISFTTNSTQNNQ